VPTVGLDATWPLIRRTGAVTTVVEPILQIALSPDTKLNPEIPNEDSVAFDFDDTNLLEVNKFPGFDLYEGGQRLNAGVTTTVDWGSGRYFRATVGQSFRAVDDPAFPPRTGLDQKTGDWVVGLEAAPLAGLTLYSRARFDNFDMQKVEAGINADLKRGAGYLRYMRQNADFAGVPREDVEGAGEIFVSKTWGITVDAVRDLEQKQWRRRAVGVVYRDECLRFDLQYQHDNNPVLGVKSSQSIVVRLTLATLGDTGYRDYARRR
jgi:LPS-assembly protein